MISNFKNVFSGVANSTTASDNTMAMYIVDIDTSIIWSITKKINLILTTNIDFSTYLPS